MKNKKFTENILKLDLQFFAEQNMLPTLNNLQTILKTLNTGGNYGASGLMSPKLAEKFIKMVQDDSSYLSQVRNEPTKTKEGTQPKLGVGRRLLRLHTEGNDNITGNEVNPVIGEVKYNNVYSCLGTSITEEWFEQNIETQGFENKFLGMIAEQEKNDVLDLAFNGDEATATTDPDYAFLHINDGFLKQVRAGGNVVDNASINGGIFNVNVFDDLLLAVPSKYVNKNFKWHCSLRTYTELLKTLRARQTLLGDNIILKGEEITIHGYGFERLECFPDDQILFCDPKNLMITWFLKIIHGKTTEGVRALYERKRFYATFLANDFIVQELAATSLLINKGIAQEVPIITTTN